MSERVTARLFKGTRDVLPEELLPRNELTSVLTRVFESYGFAPLETPAMEHLDILLGKYGVEGEKLIYKLAYKGGEVLALRYDLTVPLSRVIAMNPNLPLPFKRYQIQPVWRADQPQPKQGRFREFIQCDVDTVGTDSMAADAENVAVVHDGILALGLEDFVVRLNNRKLLRAIVDAAGLPESADADLLRVIDKLDKIGIDGVKAELATTDLDQAAATRVLEMMDVSGSPAAVLAEIGARLGDHALGREGIEELEQILSLAGSLGVPDQRLEVDLHLTRGLDYYTGPVYEVQLKSIERFGSLGGGGRYDDLMGLYGKQHIPATGVSIGLSRVLAALTQLEKLKARKSPADALIMRFPDTPLEAAFSLAAQLRAEGARVEVFPGTSKLKAQFLFAERKGIRNAILLGATEIEAGTANVKDLEAGEQVTLARDAIAAHLIQARG